MHPAGTHTYDFQIQLPKSLPSTFKGNYGYVKYFCEATIDKPRQVVKVVKVPFTVLSILDLNIQPIEFRVRQDKICFTHIFAYKFALNTYLELIFG